MSYFTLSKESIHNRIGSSKDENGHEKNPGKTDLLKMHQFSRDLISLKSDQGDPL